MDKENTKRVDNRPSSVYSILIFILIFTVCYIFYPQISMILPFSGEKVTKSKKYYETTFAQSCADGEYIVIAKANKKAKAISDGFDVYSSVSFELIENLKGSYESTFVLEEYGGTVLMKENGSRSKKYTVTYTDTASFDKGETYIIILNSDGQIVNGKYGVLKKSEKGYSDSIGHTYSIDEVKAMVEGND